MQESLNLLCAAKTFPKKKSRDAIGLANLTPRNTAAIQIFARRYNPSVLHRISLITARGGTRKRRRSRQKKAILNLLRLPFFPEIQNRLFRRQVSDMPKKG